MDTLKLVRPGRPWRRVAVDSEHRRFVEAVLEIYVSLPGTPTRASRQDRRLAKDLYEQAVPLAAIRAALFMGAARRTFRSSHVCPLPPVRTLHYFLPVIEEVLHHPSEPEYVDYLAQKLDPWIEAKLTARAAARPVRQPKETA